MHLFHCPDLSGELLELPEEEGRHATGVLRLRMGVHVGLLDGKGTVAEAEIIEAGRKGCTVRILSRDRRKAERPARIHLAVGLTKQMERLEWMIEKCTEIGVDHITPLITSRTERTKLRIDRLEKIMVAAMKQSQRAWLPQLHDATTLETFLRSPLWEQRLFGWCKGERQPLTELFDNSRDALLLIGPEGDFSPEEAMLLKEHAFTPVGLGDARLRTETAAVAACTWMNFAQMR